MKDLVPETQKALFHKMWFAKATHRCFIDGTIIRQFSYHSFAHVLPKGGYGHYKLKEENIVIMHPKYHIAQHSLGKQECIDIHEGFRKFFDLQDKLREKYNREFTNTY